MFALTGRVRVANGNDVGATAVEYGLIIALIAAVIICVLTTLGLNPEGILRALLDAI
jgi:Flp pilus assembly pilin Flp